MLLDNGEIYVLGIAQGFIEKHREFFESETGLDSDDLSKIFFKAIHDPFRMIMRSDAFDKHCSGILRGQEVAALTSKTHKMVVRKHRG